MSNERNPGYYWVKQDEEEGMIWSIAKWDGFRWLQYDTLYPYQDSAFVEIDEKQIIRAEDKTFKVPTDQAEAYRQAPFCKKNDDDKKWSENN